VPRVVILGCGTNVGKTRVGVALLRELKARSRPCLGLKPIESGIPDCRGGKSGPPAGSDAAQLTAAGSFDPAIRHPLHALPAPVSPHLAARSVGVALQVGEVAAWVSEAEATLTMQVSSQGANFTVIETAGGVFTPLSLSSSNFDLARALEPAIWVLVAADALGVLHDVSATLQAMTARGRSPDHLVLSSAREPDASTGTNALELATLGIANPIAVLARNDDRAIAALVDRLLAGSDEQAR